MDREWNDSQPIYRQLRDRVVAMILDGVLKEGDPLPSVRSVAAEYRVNPLTVLKGYQQLVDEGLIESRRTKGNQRRYARSVLRLIAIIKVAQRVGIPLAQIRDVARQAFARNALDGRLAGSVDIEH